jgi:hypothetical protein
MRVAYDSDAIFDEKSQAVKFAGQILDGRPAGRFIICHVPKDTLVQRFHLASAEPAILLQCYVAAKSEITALATKKAQLGDFRPIILAEEFSVPDQPS